MKMRLALVVCFAVIGVSHCGPDYTVTVSSPDFLKYFYNSVSSMFPPSSVSFSSSSSSSYTKLNQETNHDEEWGYDKEDGPDTWPRHFPTCAGPRQSPINLSCDSALSANFSLRFQGYERRRPMELYNSGHTVYLGWKFAEGERPRVTLSSPVVSGTYVMDRMHWHWPSEHTIDGEKYELELHVVHNREASDTSPGERTLVLGYVYKLCPFERFNLPLALVSAALLGVVRANSTAPLAVPLAPADLLPAADACDTFLYAGSLTTPPCTEDVVWLVRREPLCLSRLQRLLFRNTLRDEHGDALDENARPVQPRNSRVVRYQACGADDPYGGNNYS